jgi:sulfur relay (sulfurtransferase) DsrC/TusE family protein
MLPGDTELDQVQIDDWDEEVEEEEAAAEEEELARVHQKIERLGKNKSSS